MDADAIISNMKIHVLDHVQSAPSFLAQFGEEYKGEHASDPSLYMAMHSVLPWELEVRIAEAANTHFCGAHHGARTAD